MSWFSRGSKDHLADVDERARRYQQNIKAFQLAKDMEEMAERLRMQAAYLREEISRPVTPKGSKR